MRWIGSRQLVALALIIFSTLFLVVGWQLGFMDLVDGPGAGFFPVIMSVVMLAASLVCLLRSFGETQAVVYTKDELLVIGGGLAVALLSFIIGLIPACIVFILWWMRAVQRESLKNTVIILSICMGIAFGVFQEWLGVEFPLGIFEEWI